MEWLNNDSSSLTCQSIWHITARICVYVCVCLLLVPFTQRGLKRCCRKVCYTFFHSSHQNRVRSKSKKKIRYAQNIRSEKCKAEGLRSDGCLSVAVTLPWIKLDADLKQSNQKRSIWQYKLEVYEVRYLTFYSKFSFLSDWVFLRMFYFSRFNA